MRQSTELYACIYIPEFPAQAILRVQPDLKHSACVVMDGEPPNEAVCSFNTKAKLLGICCGMKRKDVDGFSSLVILTRSLTTESTTRHTVLECARIYSARIEESSGQTDFLCAIDTAGTERLFGLPAKLAARLSEHLRSLGLSARVVVSNNYHTAVCLAKGTVKAITVVNHGEESVALCTLPLYVLPLSEQQAEVFALWGINNLGMLAALPDNELLARIGQDGRDLQQLARGTLPHLFRPIEHSFRLEERQELDTPVELLDALMFGIAVMLDHLILQATAQLLALAGITLTLELDGGATHTCRVRPAQPGNDKSFWVTLLHLELQTHPPPAAVIAATLEADSGKTSKIQLDLFSPPLPESARLDVTLAQLKRLLGEENVGYPVLQDSYAPESFRVPSFIIPTSTVSSMTPRQGLSARLLRPSETISVDLYHSRPKRFLFREHRFIVEHLYGPWTSGGDWWNESIWNIQQWDLITAKINGPSLYCCVTHDLVRNQWHLTSIYD